MLYAKWSLPNALYQMLYAIMFQHYTEHWYMQNALCQMLYARCYMLKAISQLLVICSGITQNIDKNEEMNVVHGREISNTPFIYP